MHPELFSIGLFGLLKEPWPLHTYGLFIAMGFLLAMHLAKRQAQREGEDPEQIVDLCFYVLVAGMVGGRIVFIFTKFEAFAREPWEILAFWRGGLVWYGGFMGAVAYLAYFVRRQRMNFFKTTDLLVPSMALGHSFGRLGCLAAGCCFGRVTEQPWGIVFPNGSMAHTEQMVSGLIRFGQRALPVHPTQLYEAAGELALFALLVYWRERKTFHGQLFLIWLSVYPILRSIIEMFRGDKERGVYYVLSTSQYLSILVALAAAVMAWHVHRQRQATAL